MNSALRKITLIPGYQQGFSLPSARLLIDKSKQKAVEQGALIVVAELNQTSQTPESSHACDNGKTLLSAVNEVLAMGGALYIEPPRLIANQKLTQQNVFALEVATSKMQIHFFAKLLGEFVDLAVSASIGSLPRDEINALRNRLANQSNRTAKTGSHRHFLTQAVKLGLPALELGPSHLQLGLGEKGFWFTSSFTQETSVISSKLARDKVASNQFLRAAGLPVPQIVPVNTEKQAVIAAQALGYPVVVKATSRDGGTGVFVRLMNDQQVVEAFNAVKALGAPAAVESYIAGADYRLLVFRGKIIAALERSVASVVGDGSSSVDELIASHNAIIRATGNNNGAGKPIVIDDEVAAILREHGNELSSILPIGKIQPLRSAANFNQGGFVRGVMDFVHIDNKELAVRATQLCRLDLCGVDLIMPDITRSWREVGGGICEVNAQPYMGEPQPVNLYQTLFETINGGDWFIPIYVVLGDTNLDEVIINAIKTISADLGRVVGYATPKAAWLGDRLVSDQWNNLVDSANALLVEKTMTALILRVGNERDLNRGLPVNKVSAVVLPKKYRKGTLASYIQTFGNPKPIGSLAKMFSDINLQLQRSQ